MTEYECLQLRLQIAILSTQMKLLKIAQLTQREEIVNADMDEELDSHFNYCDANIDQIQDAWMRAESERIDNRHSKPKLY